MYLNLAGVNDCEQDRIVHFLKALRLWCAALNKETNNNLAKALTSATSDFALFECDKHRLIVHVHAVALPSICSQRVKGLMDQSQVYISYSVNFQRLLLLFLPPARPHHHLPSLPCWNKLFYVSKYADHFA